MKRALIGYTGFVGSNLLAHGTWDALFNSSNIHEIAGQHYDEIICAGVPAVKWLANKNPAEDRASIAKLTDALSGATAGHFVLISTIDVWQGQPGCHEGMAPPNAGEPYGLHRLQLENWIASTFPDHSILRLPALFGPNLKKNIIFDLLHGNQVDRINAEAEFQWYPVTRLADDMARLRAAELAVVNIATEPVRTGDVLDRFFPETPISPQPGPAPRYDMQTRYAEVLGGQAPYHMSSHEVMNALGQYLDTVRQS